MRFPARDTSCRESLRSRPVLFIAPFILRRYALAAMNKWLLAIGFSAAAASPAYAFRCGSHLITEGDTRSEGHRLLR